MSILFDKRWKVNKVLTHVDAAGQSYNFVGKILNATYDEYNSIQLPSGENRYFLETQNKAIKTGDNILLYSGDNPVTFVVCNEGNNTKSNNAFGNRDMFTIRYELKKQSISYEGETYDIPTLQVNNR